MQIIIEIPDVIAKRLQKRWNNLTGKVLELLFHAAQQAEILSETEVSEAIKHHETESNQEEVLAYMERQSALYQKHREHLIQTHKGQYILFEDGNVLDAAPDFETLILRTFEQNGPKDAFIQHVGSEDTSPAVRTPFLSKAL
ncbi:MAG: hypothetical protein ACFB16_07840 [Phormidesmis sp.]